MSAGPGSRYADARSGDHRADGANSSKTGSAGRNGSPPSVDSDSNQGRAPESPRRTGEGRSRSAVGGSGQAHSVLRASADHGNGDSSTGHATVEVIDGFSVITARHLDRLLGGELLATQPRIDWARLMRRTLALDPLACPRCGARLRAIAEITDGAVIDRILAHLSTKSSRAPPQGEISETASHAS